MNWLRVGWLLAVALAAAGFVRYLAVGDGWRSADLAFVFLLLLVLRRDLTEEMR